MVSLDKIPAKYQPIFAGFNRFNELQSSVFNDVLESRKDIVISAATGSGKTTIFELAIIKLMSADPQNNFKIIYVSPTKALCAEVYSSWSKKFTAYDINVALVTGESDPKHMSNLGDIKQFQVIVTTPEKWESMTNDWTQYHDIASSIQLFCIDEVHLIGDERRGSTVEAIILRTKYFKANIRYIAASASLPNIDDFAHWFHLLNPENGVKTIKENAAIAANIERVVIGCQSQGNYFQFNSVLSTQICKIIRDGIDSTKQILIFCHSCADVEKTADLITKTGRFNAYIPERAISENVEDIRLCETVKHGVGFHHAGLSIKDRDGIEQLYRAGIIRVLVSTSTLAFGINLPSHTVIIKSTEVYREKGTEEIQESMIVQMIGRAGRSPFEKYGRAYILTRLEHVERYKNLVSVTKPIESHLMRRLPELLNAEIVLGAIENTEDSLLNWIRYSFDYARHAHSPEYLNEFIEVCRREIRRLEASKLVILVKKCVESLPFGRIMATYYLNRQTVDDFQTFHGNECVESILHKISRFTEFTEMYVPQAKFQAATKKTLRYAVNPKEKNNHNKAFCFLQLLMDHTNFEDATLRLDLRKFEDRAVHLLNALIEFFCSEQATKTCFEALRSAVLLINSIKMHYWLNESSFLNFIGISESDWRNLLRCNVRSVDDFWQAHAELNCKKKYFYSDPITSAEDKLPNLQVRSEKAGENCIVRVTQENPKFHWTTDAEHVATILVGDSNNRILAYKKIEQYASPVFEAKLLCPTDATHIIVYIIHHHLVGFETKSMLPVALETKPIVKVNSNSPLAQQRIDSFFKKSKFVEPKLTNYDMKLTQQTVKSVDLFSEISEPNNRLYDFGHTTQKSFCAPKIEKFCPKVEKEPVEYQTPIRAKIATKRNSLLNFVTAKKLFSNDHAKQPEELNSQDFHEFTKLIEKESLIQNHQIGNLNAKHTSSESIKPVAATADFSPRAKSSFKVDAILQRAVKKTAIREIEQDFDNSGSMEKGNMMVQQMTKTKEFMSTNEIDEQFDPTVVGRKMNFSSTKSVDLFSDVIERTQKTCLEVESQSIIPKRYHRKMKVDNGSFRKASQFEYKPLSQIPKSTKASEDAANVMPAVKRMRTNQAASSRVNLAKIIEKCESEGPSYSSNNTAMMRSSLSCPLAHVKLVQPKPEPSADDIMKEYKQRLATDSNYTQDDYQKDYIRYNILKIPPKAKNTAATQPINAEINNTIDIFKYCENFELDENVFNPTQFNFY